MTTTEERMETLEKQIKSMKGLVVGLFVLFVGTFVMFVLTAGGLIASVVIQPDVIRAKQFEVVNNSSAAVVRIGETVEGHGYIDTLNSNGQELVEITSAYDGDAGVIVTSNGSGGTLVEISTPDVDKGRVGRILTMDGNGNDLVLLSSRRLDDEIEHGFVRTKNDKGDILVLIKSSLESGTGSIDVRSKDRGGVSISSSEYGGYVSAHSGIHPYVYIGADEQGGVVDILNRTGDTHALLKSSGGAGYIASLNDAGTVLAVMCKNQDTGEGLVATQNDKEKTATLP